MYDQNNLDLLLVNEALGDHALKKNDGAKAPNCAYATTLFKSKKSSQ